MSETFTLPSQGHLPTIAVAAELPADADALIVAMLSGEDGLELPSTGLGESVDREILESLTSLQATGKPQQVVKIPAPKELDVNVVVAVGLGDGDDVDEETVRRAAGVVGRQLTGVHHAASTLNLFGLEEAITGLSLGAYTYRGRKTDEVDAAKAPLGAVTFLGDPAKDSDVVSSTVALVESVAFARDLVNTSSDALYPESYAAIAQAAGEKVGLSVEILDYEALVAGGFGGLVGVGSGSSRKPRLVRLSWNPEGATKKVALVGKGITFDTGGISLKPGAQMDHMISDMGGSASVVASVIAAARLGLKVAVTATVPMAENMPGGQAYRPGDILTQYGGKTVEVLNTDAEGRLVLADAIVRACEDQPDYLIETATLTGAQLVALGSRTSGVMGSEQFRDRVAEIGRGVGEQAWAMPFPEEIGERLKSPVADLRNITQDRFGGMMAAGMFLGEFVAEDVQWVHIDIAGPAFNTTAPYGYVCERGTGVPVRTIVATLADIADNG
ncbi:leucyl aminopeptidase [Corynebacterium aquilae]|uniref:Probable cytosol aminopeptidase n=1 Tax=Corynebacterium aquilae DSM 44791 TaxID=1431546 RepID=A0A1L7CHB0_9CORY|nr:leucyl aminopeptidase [Corynebacterium aquilae]APT85133.1 aminopeptidase A [Corynebacterium aquilae DSM 44791]